MPPTSFHQHVNSGLTEPFFIPATPSPSTFRGIRSLFLVRPVLAQLLNEIDDGFEFRSHIV